MPDQSTVVVVKQIEEEIVSLCGEALLCKQVWRIGELLEQAKALLPHGAYMPWIRDTLPAIANISSYKTANKYSALYSWLKEMPIAQQLLLDAPYSVVYNLHLGIKGDSSPRSQSIIHLFHNHREVMTVSLVERLVSLYKSHPTLLDKIVLMDCSSELLQGILRRAVSKEFLDTLDGWIVGEDPHLSESDLYQIDANLEVVEPKGDRAVTSCASCTFFDRQGALPGQTSMIGRCNKFHKELNLSDLDHGLNCDKWVRREETEPAAEKAEDKVERLEREEFEEVETVGPSTKAMDSALVQWKEGETRTVNVRDRLHRNMEKYVFEDKPQLLAQVEKLGLCELIAIAVLYRVNLEGCELTLNDVKQRVKNIQWIDQ